MNINGNKFKCGRFFYYSGHGKICHWGKKDSLPKFRSISFSEEELKKKVYAGSRIWICTEKIDNIYYDTMPVTEKFLSFAFNREALQLIQLYVPADVKVPYERDIESV